MFGRNRHNRMTDPNFVKDEGYQRRFGTYGMRGSARHHESEPSNYTYGQPDERHSSGVRRSPSGYSDYASFEGATDRPYYGGEEGRFPFGGAPVESNQRQETRPETRQETWNADERKHSATWSRGGTHTGKGPKGYRRSDERIREEVCELLTENADLDASEIEVLVKDGEVSLSGVVENRMFKRLAEDIAESVTGVVDVRNELRAASISNESRASGHFSSSDSPKSATMTSEKEVSNAARGVSTNQRRMNS